MILTGKAKEDFLKWVNLTEDMFLCAHSDREITSLTIEWFDSVGIYIEINRATNSLKFFAWFFTITDIKGVHQNSHIENFIKEDSRDKVTEQAIIKANEIYNHQYQ